MRVPTPSSSTKQYGSSTDTMNRRWRSTMRCVKITDMDFSSTVKASELKKSIVAARSQPVTCWFVRNPESSSMSGRDWPGTIHSR